MPVQHQSKKLLSHILDKLSFYLRSVKIPLLINLLPFFLLSCSETPQQYKQPSSKDDIPVEWKSPHLITEATNPEGGLLLYQPVTAVTTEEQKDIATRENSLAPIRYQSGSVANISMKTTYEDALNILNYNFSTPSGLDVYKEGIAVLWRDDSPRIPDAIIIASSYQGTMDFGPWIGENRQRQIGHSFADQFSVGEKYQDILADPKARHFIISLYKHLENTEEDCLETKNCSLSINPQGSYIVFQFAKMTLLFGNNERRNLAQLAFLNDNDPACFNSPFDFLNFQFLCDQEDGSKTLFRLGDNYKEVIEKSGVNPNLPITYSNTILIQRTKSTAIAWKRQNFEEKTKQVPDTTHLSLVYMGSNYNIPFLFNQSLIKASLGDSNTVKLSLEPLSEEGGQWTLQDILQKTEAVKDHSSEFYLGTEMPQIRGNVIVQINLIKALFDLLEENYAAAYSSTNSTIKIQRRVFGEYDDKFAVEPIGYLIISNPKGRPDDFLTKYPLKIYVDIDQHSGKAEWQFSVVDDDFQNYLIKKQKDILDFLEPVQELGGFKLGDKIYLRDKKMSSRTITEDQGQETAIVAYPASDSETLITLANYSSEAESRAVYTSGRDNNIIFETSEAISFPGIGFYILPTSHTKEIQGHVFDEYEIHKIAVNGTSFFGTIRSLCAIEDFDMEMGSYDRAFSKTIAHHISKAQSSSDKPFKGCTYISPIDPLFSGLKRAFFFPSHQSILSFANRELYGITIYKKPPNKKTKGKAQ